MRQFIDPYLDESTYKQILEFCNYFETLTKELEIGRNRATFIFSNNVIKVPISRAGFTDNDWEASITNAPETFNNYVFEQYPRTKLIIKSEIPLLRMERIWHASPEEIQQRLGMVPEWVTSIDCSQVGFTRAGRLCAYDYGLY